MRKHYTPAFSTITVSFIILWIITEAINYIYYQGVNFILYTSVGWSLAYVSAIAFSKIIEFLSLFITHVQKFSYAIILFPLAPTLYIFSEIAYLSAPRWLPLSYGPLKILFAIDICLTTIITIIICILLYSKKYLQALANLTKGTTDISPSASNTLLSEPELLLGQGNANIDRVIQSLLYRANRAEKTAKLSLVAIILLVFIGGSISIGTIALDQFSKLRQLEKVRQEMLTAVNKLNTESYFYEYLNLNNSPEKAIIKHDSAIAKAIQKNIETTFGSLEDTKNYKQLLENVQRKESYNISEIVMRVAIAALTFFLVQVFLRIYKYNKQQCTSLLTKAEVLELFNEPGTDMKKLREILASKIEENPKFGNTPTTPIEQIINIADKAKSNGTGS
jgi:hypothetical protein